MNMSKKRITIDIVTIVGLLVFFIFINLLINRHRELLNINTEDYNFRNDSFDISDGSIVLSGWCYKKGEDTYKLGSDVANGFKVILFDESKYIFSREDLDAATIVMKTIRTERPDVYKTFSSKENFENDYTYSGYKAFLDINEVDLSDTDYIIAYRYGDENNHLIKSPLHINDYLLK